MQISSRQEQGRTRGSEKQRLVEVLRQGGVAVYPTDTVYGVGCRIDDETAIKRLYVTKQRNYNQPVPILVADAKDVERYVDQIPALAKRLMDQFWPGPLTIILPVKENSVLPYFLLQGKASFRIPNVDALRQVIRDIGVPIIGTSANLHGHLAVAQGKKLDSSFTNQVDYVLIGEDGSGKESTVVSVGQDNTIALIREGSITKSQLDI